MTIMNDEEMLYTAHEIKFRKKVRDWTETEIRPLVDLIEQDVEIFHDPVEFGAATQRRQRGVQRCKGRLVVAGYLERRDRARDRRSEDDLRAGTHDLGHHVVVRLPAR